VHAVLTTCSAEKRRDARMLPAVQRYTHPRIAEARAKATAAREPLLILSGVFGLLDAWTPIPWYDHALRDAEVAALVPRVSGRLRSRQITALDLWMSPPGTPGWAPYHAVVQRAAAEAGVALRPRWVAPR
jgi:hypothetical protein